VHAPTGQDEGKSKSGKQDEQHARGMALKQSAVPEALRAFNWIGMKLKNGGKYGSPENREAIRNYP